MHDYSNYNRIQNSKDWPIVQLHKNKKIFLNEVISKTMAMLLERYGKEGDRLQKMLRQTTEREIQRTLTTPWKVDPPYEVSFWEKIATALEKKGAEQMVLNRITTYYSHEISSKFDKKHYHVVIRGIYYTLLNLLKPTWQWKEWLTWFPFARKLEDQIHLIKGSTQLSKLSQKGTIVIVPTHSSHLDSIVAGWLIRKLGLPPFIYGTGLNLFNSKIFSCLLGRVGTYRLDRRKRNIPYLQTLDIYARMALEWGCHSLFYPGGTRTRSGAIETDLKLGLLNTAFEAQKDNYQTHGMDAPKIFIVPIVINYSCVIEAPTLIKDYFNSTINVGDNPSWLRRCYQKLILIKNICTRSAEIAVSIGKPLDVLGNYVDEEGNSYDHAANRVNTYAYFESLTKSGNVYEKNKKESIKQVGERITISYRAINCILASHLTAFTIFTLLQQQYPTLAIADLYKLPKDKLVIPYAQLVTIFSKLYSAVMTLYRGDKIQVAPIFHKGNLTYILQHGLKHLGNYHINRPLVYHRYSGLIFIKDLLTLYYYHSRLTGYELEKEIL